MLERAILPILRACTATLTKREPRLIMYHRFSAAPAYRRMPITTLVEHIDAAREFCDIVTVREAVARLRADDRPPRPLAALTVDDGHRDFYEFAWPVLRRAGIPVTIYLSGDFIEHRQWLWPDALEYLLMNSRRPSIRVELDGADQSYDLADIHARRRAWEKISERLLFDNELRSVVLERIARAVQVDLPDAAADGYSPLTWEQVRELARHGCELGSHGLSHSFMAALSSDAAAQELRQSKSLIEARTGCEVRGFAYPNGDRADVSERIDALAQACGYEYSVCSFRTAERVTPDTFRLGRMAGGGDARQARNVMAGLSLTRKGLALRLEGLTRHFKTKMPSASRSA